MSFVFRPSSPQDKKVAIDQQPDEVYRVRATLIRIHFELSAENIRDLSNGSSPVAELEDALRDV
jgi:hypothetical protein